MDFCAMMSGFQSGGFLNLAQPKAFAGYLEIFQRKSARSFFYDSGRMALHALSPMSPLDRWLRPMAGTVLIMARAVPKLTLCPA